MFVQCMPPRRFPLPSPPTGARVARAGYMRRRRTPQSGSAYAVITEEQCRAELPECSSLVSENFAK